MATTTQLVPGWNGGANTIAELPWDGYYTFQLGQRTGIVVGLSKTVCNGAWSQIEHAFMVQGDAVSIYESGVKKYGPTILVVEEKTFKIERRNRQVKYYLDDDLLYTSSNQSWGMVWLDAALFAKDDTIIDATLVTETRVDETAVPTYNVDPETGQLVDSVTGDPILAESGESLTYGGTGFQFGGWAADDEAGDFGNAWMQFGGAGTSYDLAIGDGATRFHGYGADTSDATAHGQIRFWGSANDVQTPDTSYGTPFIQFYSNGEALTDLAGTGDGEFSFFGHGSETAFDWGWGRFGLHSEGSIAATPPALVWAVLDWPLIGATAYTPFAPYDPFTPYDPDDPPQYDPETGYLIDPETGYLVDPDTGYLIDPETGYLIDPGTGNLLDPVTGQPIVGTSGGASALFEWPAFVGEAIATVSNNTALFQWPAFEGSAHAGAQVLFDWPTIEGESTATNPGFATALFDWPAFEGEATAFTGQVANATFNWPGFAGEAYSGGTALFDWPTFEGDGAATVGAVANALFDWPAIEGESSATVFGTASALFDWPAFEGEAGDGIHVLFDWPAFAGSASATHAVVIADAETYAVNLSTGAVTRLLLGPLDKLVTAYGKLYALRNGELLVLAGDNDGLDGEDPIPIPATVRFAQQNFGILNAKRCHAVYLNAREDDGLTLDIVEDERTIWRYQTPTDTAPAMGTHRVKTGRGLKFHTLGVVVQNREGGRLDIGGMELFVQPLVPRPKT